MQKTCDENNFQNETNAKMLKTTITHEMRIKLMMSERYEKEGKNNGKYVKHENCLIDKEKSEKNSKYSQYF